MARVHLPEQDTEIRDPKEIRDFLSQYGIIFEQWEVAGRIGADATNEEILTAYEPEIARLKASHGLSRPT